MKNFTLSELKEGLFKYDVKDYHAILGVPIDADVKAVRYRYLKIAYIFHPDTCQLDTQEQKQKASEILSKLVNPAYENLYREKPRRECQLILSEMGRRLASDSSQVTIVSESAKKLHGEKENLDQVYRQLIEQLARDQYQDLHLIPRKISLMSELNMVYLMLQKEAELTSLLGKKPKARVAQGEPVATQTTEQSPAETKKDPASSTRSRISRLIDSARDYQENQDFERGIFDMREALKIDPNNSTIHALIGSLYQGQGNIPMAKVHIKKALELDPRDPELDPQDKMVRQIQQELKAKGKTKARKPTQKPQAKKNQKESPKIFGIRLW